MEFLAEKLDWNGKAGQRLDEFARRLPAQPRLEITIFGSAPLQLFIERTFLSEDIDLFGNEDTTAFLEQFVGDNKWNKGETALYIQVCDPLAFKSTIVEQPRHRGRVSLTLIGLRASMGRPREQTSPARRKRSERLPSRHRKDRSSDRRRIRSTPATCRRLKFPDRVDRGGRIGGENS